MAFVSVWHIFVYCPLAHWIFYTGGWLAQYGAIDFAGGMVVHTSSGVSAFVLTYWLGRGTKPNPSSRPHNVPYVLLGAALRWFGWFGCVARVLRRGESGRERVHDAACGSIAHCG